MKRSIITLDNSRYKKEYNKYFYISSDWDSSPIRNKELSDEVFKAIFETANSIVVLFPDETGRIDGNVGYKIKEESVDSKVKTLDQLDGLRLHSTELHELPHANCKEAVHHIEFEDYSEIVNFLDWEELGVDAVIKVYTALKKPEDMSKEPQNITNITNNTTDNSVKTEIHNNGSFNKNVVKSGTQKSKSWWKKILSVLGALFRGS